MGDSVAGLRRPQFRAAFCWIALLVPPTAGCASRATGAPPSLTRHRAISRTPAPELGESRLVVEEGARSSALRVEFHHDDAQQIWGKIGEISGKLGVRLWRLESTDSPAGSDTFALAAPPPPVQSATTLWAAPAADGGSIELLVSSEAEAEASRLAGIAGLWLEASALVYPVATRWTVRGRPYTEILAEVRRQISNSDGAVVEGLAGHETRTFRVTSATPQRATFTIEVSEQPGDAELRLVAHNSPVGLALGQSIVGSALDALSEDDERRE